MTKDLSIETKLVQVGNYRFTGRVLGKGSFAVVKEAVHMKLNVSVAVKTIDLKKCNNYTLKNYLRESAVLQSLDHPFVLRLFETMTHNNIYYMVTEVVKGGDLCTYVRQKKGKVDENTARRFSRQICLALRYLHSSGIVHRDLKLENVMLDSANRNIKLIDFGLTNSWSQDSPLKTLCGSPEYSAPELFVPGTVYGPEVDMWALGVIMFAMAAGRLPFPCVSTIMKVPEKKNQFLKSINDGLSETQTNLLRGYSPEFTQLVKQLMNPMCNERLSINDIFSDKWLTNRNHWVDVPHDTLDAYDLEKIVRELSNKLRMSTERLRSELKSKPCGEAGGFFRILSYEALRARNSSMQDIKSDRSQTKTFSSSLYNLSRKPSTKQISLKAQPKLSLIGSAMKLNEVTLTSPPARANVPTSSDSSTVTSGQSERGFKKYIHASGQTKVLLQKMGYLNSQHLITPSTSPKILTVSPRKETKSIQVDITSKRTYSSGRVILPSKLKKTSNSKSFWEQEPRWLRKLV